MKFAVRDIYARVRRRCKQKGMSLRALSDEMRVDRALLTRTISNSTNVRLSTLIKLSDALDVRPEWFLVSETESKSLKRFEL